MTISQIRKACKKHDFIMVRNSSGFQYAVNCKVVFIGKKNTEKHGNKLSPFISYYPVSFMEYICNKVPFI